MSRSPSARSEARWSRHCLTRSNSPTSAEHWTNCMMRSLTASSKHNPNARSGKGERRRRRGERTVMLTYIFRRVRNPFTSTSTEESILTASTSRGLELYRTTGCPLNFVVFVLVAFQLDSKEALPRAVFSAHDHGSLPPFPKVEAMTKKQLPNQAGYLLCFIVVYLLLWSQESSPPPSIRSQ